LEKSENEKVAQRIRIFINRDFIKIVSNVANEACTLIGLTASTLEKEDGTD